MTHDPLAPFRREPKQELREPDTGASEITWSEEGRRQGPPDEHRALRAAIDALNQIPNTPLSGAYKNIYALIPVLETVYRNAEDTARALTPLEELAPRMYRTLLLCEDVLSELGRLDDGTSSISALIDIRAIRREAGDLSEEQVIQLMQGRPVQPVTAPETAAGGAATRELLDAATVAWQRGSNHEVMTLAECNQLHAAIVNAADHPLAVSGHRQPMTDAEIDAAVAHDLKLIEEARQHWREPDRESDREPER